MAKEISDADFELLSLSKKVLGGKNRLSQLKLMKAESPDLSLPELEQEERISAALSPLQEENKKLRERLDATDVQTGLRTQRENAVKILQARGYAESDLPAIEKIMIEKKIGTHEAAVEFHDLNNRVAAPKHASPSWDKRAQVPANEGLAKDPAAWAREEAAKTLDELRGVGR